MQVVIKYLGFDPTEKLADFAYSRVDNLERFSKKIISAEVTFKKLKGKSQETKLCQLYISVPGKNLFVAKKGIDFETALVDSIDALKKQLRQKKTERINRIQKQIKRKIEV